MNHLLDIVIVRDIPLFKSTKKYEKEFIFWSRDQIEVSLSDSHRQPHSRIELQLVVSNEYKTQLSIYKKKNFHHHNIQNNVDKTRKES